VAEQTDHDRFREAIYADETAPGAVEHLAECEECRRLVARLKRIDQRIRDTPIPEPRPGLVDDILAGIAGTRLSISFSPKTASVLDELADVAEITEAEVIRRALSLYWWVYRERELGNKLLIQRRDVVTEWFLAEFERG
jgi:hypothetical protein